MRLTIGMIFNWMLATLNIWVLVHRGYDLLPLIGAIASGSVVIFGFFAKWMERAK